jgi:hypothetical protein
MSDLQCPATLWLAATTGDAGGLDAADVAARLADRRIALVHGDRAGGRTAETVGDLLGVPVHAGTDVTAPDTLQDLADQHRGESVLVVADAEALGRVLGAAPDPGTLVEVSVDADGWVIGRPASP